MLLMDTIAATAQTVTREGGGRDPVLRAFPALAKALVGTPRFLFDQNAIATAVELTLGRPKVLREAMHHLQVPYKRMWVEWEEAGRQRLRDRFETQNNLPLPQRVGYLLESDDGRRGTITWLWTSSAKNVLTIGKFDCPCVAPICAYFDLDGDIAQPQHLTDGLFRANLGQLWGDNPIQFDALKSIWTTAEHKPSPWGEEYLLSIYQLGHAGFNVGHVYGKDNYHNVTSDADFQQFLAVQYQDVYGEYIQAWATMMLLTASRPVIERTHVSLDKLNKQRRKKGEPPLYDHTRVTLHVQARNLGPVIERGPLGYARKSPRIHMVSSYLARRGNRHWIVMPYMRGKGETIHRVTRVTP